jgi:hypothetical protein
MRRLSCPKHLRLSPLLVLPVLMALSGAPVRAQGVLVTTGTVEDRRTTGQFFGGLEIELKVTGDDLADAKASRVLVKKAVDATGKDLLPESSSEEDFRDSSGGNSSLKVSLKNPARGAAAVREVAGEIQLFVPGRDPAATASVDKFLSRMDKPLSSPGLKAAQIEVRLVSPKTYKANLEKSQAEMEKEMEKHRAELQKEAEKEGVDAGQADALIALAKGLMGMMGDVGENDLVFEIKDKQKRLYDVEVVNKAGKTIDRNGSMSSGDVRILHFTEKLPADARLRFLIRTDKSVQRSPFALKDVPLP